MARQKNSEKNSNAPPAAPSEAPKKPQKSSSTNNGLSNPPSRGSRSSRSCLGVLLSMLFYAVMIGAVGLTAFYLQQVVEESRRAQAAQAESARHNAQLGAKMETAVQQVDSLKSAVDTLESSLGVTRAELEAAVIRLKRGEVETRRVEEALQKLQNDLLLDLSEGIKEVKQSREQDFSSLERTVQERLAEVSQSIAASVAEFAGAQGEVQTQLADLRAQLGGGEDQTLIKQELSDIVQVVAEMKAAREGADATADSLKQRVEAVREEVQVQGGEMSSLTQEVERLQSTMEETSGSLKEALSGAEAGVEALREKSEALQGGVEQLSLVAHAAEEKADAASDWARERVESLDTRVRALEASGQSLSATAADVMVKMESLLAKYDNHESGLALQASAVEKIKAELEAMKTSAGDSGVAPVQVKDLEQRLAALEESGKHQEGLTTTLEEIKSNAAKLEEHQQAIIDLQRRSQELAASSENKKGGSLDQVRSEISALSGEQNQLRAKDSDLDQQVGELQSRVAALEEGNGLK